MARERILIVDDDADIRDILKLTLEEESYEVIEGANGEEAIKLIESKTPHMVILDYKMPKLNGAQVCKLIKKDILLRHMPVIMLTGKSETSDKIQGIDAGADDYIVKPFEPPELLARIRMILRRSSRDLDANPLTHLPGNVSILNELQSRLDDKNKFSVCYVDLDKFKAYNDKYGFKKGDEVIKETARILIATLQALGNKQDFIGHIGGDDFVVVTTGNKSDAICSRIISEFDKISPSFYNETDRKNGYITTKDRKGIMQKIPLLSISIGVATDAKELGHVAKIGEVGAELKEVAKSLEKSNFVKERRI